MGGGGVVVFASFPVRNMARSAFRNDGNKFYKTHGILVLMDDGDQSSSFVRDIAFSLAAPIAVSVKVTSSPANRKQSRAHARKSPSLRVHLPVDRG